MRKSGIFFGFHKETLTFIVCEVVSAYVAMPICICVAGSGTSRIFFFDLGQLMLCASKLVIVNRFRFAADRTSTFSVTVFGIARRRNVPVAVFMVGHDGDFSRLSPIAVFRCVLFNYHTPGKRYIAIFGTAVIELSAAADSSAFGIAVSNNVAAVDDDVAARRAIPFAGVCAAADSCREAGSPIIFTSAGVCGYFAAVDDEVAAGTRLTAADTCCVVAATSVDDAAVDSDIACLLAVVTADTRRSACAGSV